MPLVCYNRPNRTRRRAFTPRDLERLSARVLEDGWNPWVLLAYTAAGLGLGGAICIFAESAKRVLAVSEVIEKIADALATTISIRALLRVLGLLARVTPARIRVLLTVIIGLFVAVEQWRGTFRDAIRGYQQMRSVLDNLSLACDTLVNLVPGIESPPEFPAPPLPPTPVR